jgi:hypothetical protein
MSLRWCSHLASKASEGRFWTLEVGSPELGCTYSVEARERKNLDGGTIDGWNGRSLRLQTLYRLESHKVDLIVEVHVRTLSLDVE